RAQHRIGMLSDAPAELAVAPVVSDPELHQIPEGAGPGRQARGPLDAPLQRSGDQITASHVDQPLFECIGILSAIECIFESRIEKAGCTPRVALAQRDATQAEDDLGACDCLTRRDGIAEYQEQRSIRARSEVETTCIERDLPEVREDLRIRWLQP